MHTIPIVLVISKVIVINKQIPGLLSSFVDHL